MPKSNPELPRRPIVPKEFGGKWIAWNYDTTRIIASADDLETVAKAARNAGEEHPSFEKVLRPDVRISVLKTRSVCRRTTCARSLPPLAAVEFAQARDRS